MPQQPKPTAEKLIPLLPSSLRRIAASGIDARNRPPTYAEWGTVQNGTRITQAIGLKLLAVL